MTWRNTILVGDVREQLRTLPDESVHCVVTSPPYWGLRDYGSEGQLGLEATPEEFVCNMVAVFREVRRVLRKDGTLWLNLGDSYAGSGKGSGGEYETSAKQNTNRGANYLHGEPSLRLDHGLKQKDLVGIPWRVAFALQADGWWLRSDIVWSKPNPMPESVTDRPTKSHEYLFLLTKSERYYYDAEAIREPLAESSIQRINQPNFANQTGGPKDYALTGEGIHSQRKTLENFARANAAPPTPDYFNFRRDTKEADVPGQTMRQHREDRADSPMPSGRNRRTVWEIPTQPYAEAHFATYPEALVLPCIQAGTSEHGVCSVCGAPWRRVVEANLVPTEKAARTFVIDERDEAADSGDQGSNRQKDGHKPGYIRADRTLGWIPTCKHEAPLERAVVLDPFMGSGTTGLVAKRAGRDYVGIELNETYAALAEERIGYQGVLL